MNTPEIEGMVRALKPVLKDRLKAKAILERYWTSRIALVWTVRDIHKAANERGLALSRKESRELLNELKVHYDRQLGIKWTDLWDLVDSSECGRRMTKQEEKAFVERNTIAISRT